MEHPLGDLRQNNSFVLIGLKSIIPHYVSKIGRIGIPKTSSYLMIYCTIILFFWNTINLAFIRQSIVGHLKTQIKSKV